MISHLSVENFAALEQAELDFSPGLNVILGENSTGKSLLMKLMYSGAWVSHSLGKGDRKTKDELQRAIADKLKAVCIPESLGRLVTRKAGRNRCTVRVSFSEPQNASFGFSFATNSDREAKLDGATPEGYLSSSPIFIPTKEVLSVFPNFAATLRSKHLFFDDTYLDLLDALDQPVNKGAPKKDERELRDSLEQAMAGRVVFDGGRFYYLPEAEGKGKIEMPLVAEGLRKISILTYLVMNGGLRNKSLLFWDEPEVNLNPKLMRRLAVVLVDMAERGVQVILATHSLFLLRELVIARASSKTKEPVRFFALSKQGDTQRVTQGDSVEEVDPLASLDAELEQSDRYLELP
ncbi:MAG: AAA family ATPase [Spirochaetales bacterium]